MANLKLRGKDLQKIGYPKGSPVMSLAMQLMTKHYKHHNKGFVLDLLKKVKESPEAYKNDDILSRIAVYFGEFEAADKEQVFAQAIDLIPPNKAIPYTTYGSKFIDSSAKQQMNLAMQLPVTAAGALMADAHAGYGLPIGGVVALDNAVMPYGVGMDIGCRMCLSIYDISGSYVERNKYQLALDLKEQTRFGKEVFSKVGLPDILEREEFKTIKTVRNLKDKAWKQFGTSGSGNHFVEFGIVEIKDINNEFDLLTRQYLGVLSHSGSRGLGANIAQYYTKVAREKCWLPKVAQQLAWLDLDTEAGQEYWLAMNLAGDYASACHHDIHRRLSERLGERPLAVIENHHNFAWKEQLPNGKNAIVHRKGATPAGKGVLGIIPGSMTAAAFIVRGKGNTESLNSASHGAGRAMSRTKAKNSFTMKSLRQELSKHRVKLIGGGIDEAPMAYKDIRQVMNAQTNLVDVIGTFLPKIVRMDKG